MADQERPAAPAARVLIADDEPGLRLMVRLTLEVEPDFAVVGEAADGDAAVRLAAELAPDIVLLDHSMPGLSGLEAAAAIRGLLPAAMIVLMSGYERDELESRARDGGATAYIEKGSVTVDLPAVLRRLAGSAGAG